MEEEIMKSYAILTISAAILALAPAFAGGPAKQAATTNQTDPMRRMEMRRALTCAKTFDKGTYPGASHESYTCTGSFIRCPVPDDPAMMGFTQPQPVVKTPDGVRFSYRCIYMKNPG